MGDVLLVLAVVVLLAAVGALIWLRRTLVVVFVVGRSMEPTLHSGARVMARRTPVERIRVGDVVVVQAPAQLTRATAGAGDSPGLLIKRVFAVPGDPVPTDRVPALRGGSQPYVPAGNLVLLGDNPSFSYDSRQYGYFTADQLLGLVVRPRLRARTC